MRHRKTFNYEKQFQLNGQSIDTVSSDIEAELTSIEVESLNRIRIRLSIEEALLRMREQFGEETEFAARIYYRFSRPVIEIALEDAVFNPLKKEQSGLANWAGSLLTSVGMTPHYSYEGGTNFLRITLRGKRINPVLKMVVAIAIGIGLGLLGSNFMPESAQIVINDMLLEPLFDMWYRVLLAMSGPVIFLMVITNLLNNRHIAEQGGDGRKVVARYFMLSLIAALASMFVGGSFFRPSFANNEMDQETATNLIENLLQIIPENVLSPLIEANTPQILLLAFVLGTALIVIGSRVDRLTNLIRQCNLVAMLMAEWVSKLVPYFAAVLICMQIIARESLVRDLWKAFLTALCVSALFIGVLVTYVSVKMEVSPGILVRKLWKPFSRTLRTGSLEETYGLSEQVCNKDLGIEKNYLSVTLPQGLVLYMPINVIGTLALTVYAASRFEITVTIVWFVVAMVLAVILFVATPPVPGANLLAYIAIFAQLGIASQTLIDAMVFDIVFGIFAAAANLAMLQLDLVIQANSIGLLDKDCLKKDSI